MANSKSVTVPDALPTATAHVPPLPDHAAAHSILSEIEDALQVGNVLTAEFVTWCRAKFAEAKSHL